MFTEFHHIFFLGMSNPELFVADQVKKQVALMEVSSRPTFEFPEEKWEGVASSDQELMKKTTSPAFGSFEVADGGGGGDDDDDGFRTPTSLEHKIPAATKCPPTPKKKLRRPRRPKRKASLPLRRRSLLQVDLSNEVESMFPPPLREDLGRKIKRARVDDGQ
ncbi:hypothetical protein U1Q18_008451 [Sarracenia purpurea var. burkii]